LSVNIINISKALHANIFQTLWAITLFVWTKKIVQATFEWRVPDVMALNNYFITAAYLALCSVINFAFDTNGFYRFKPNHVGNMCCTQF